MAATFVDIQTRIPNLGPLSYQRMDNNLENLQKQLPIGAYIDYPVGGDIPDTFFECDGSQLAETTYSELFSVIGTTFNDGGEDAGNFRLPDTRGYFLRHVGGIDEVPSREAGSLQDHALQYHTHTMGPFYREGTTRLQLMAYHLDVYNADAKSWETAIQGSGTETRPSNVGTIRLIKAISTVPPA